MIVLYWAQSVHRIKS